LRQGALWEKPLWVFAVAMIIYAASIFVEFFRNLLISFPFLLVFYFLSNVRNTSSEISGDAQKRITVTLTILFLFSFFGLRTLIRDRILWGYNQPSTLAVESRTVSVCSGATNRLLWAGADHVVVDCHKEKIAQVRLKGTIEVLSSAGDLKFVEAHSERRKINPFSPGIDAEKPESEVADATNGEVAPSSKGQ
jgi:hypothetical protein